MEAESAAIAEPHESDAERRRHSTPSAAIRVVRCTVRLLLLLPLPALVFACVCTLEDASADGDGRGEGALLVDIGSLDGLLGRAESESDRLVESNHAVLLLGQQTGLGLGNSRLLLECALDLTQQQRHRAHIATSSAIERPAGAPVALRSSLLVRVARPALSFPPPPVAHDRPAQPCCVRCAADGDG